MEYSDIVKDVYSDTKKLEYLSGLLRDSMGRIGFSPNLIADLTDNLSRLDVSGFVEKHKTELKSVELGHFFDELVPVYFSKYVVPHIPTEGKILDLGCGRGTLMKCLFDRNATQDIVGIDIISAPEWKNFSDTTLRFEVVQEFELESYLQKEQPDTVVLTWVLHHMEYDQQKRYIEKLRSVLGAEVTIVILEDAYSELQKPESDNGVYESFMEWSPADRFKIMGAQDWIANRIFSMRSSMPVPFAYLTLEEWEKLFVISGFDVVKTQFIGFPENRDVHNPQSVLVAKSG